MGKLSSFSVITLFVCISIVGVSIVSLLSIQLIPSAPSSHIHVSYFWRNASAKVLEVEVTSKLEGLFNNIREVKNINSVSAKGRGIISIEFKKNTDMEAARFEVATLVRQSFGKLPDEVSYPVISMGRGNDRQRPIMTYSIQANFNPLLIQKYAESHIASKLSVIKGVNEVNVYGATPFEWEVTYNVDKMRHLGISQEIFVNAINRYLGKQGLGKDSIENRGKVNGDEVSVLLLNRPFGELEWGGVPIGNDDSRVIYLRDVATIHYRESETRQYYRINGLNTISVVVNADKDENIIVTAKKVREEVAKIKTGLPKEYHIKLVSDSSQFLENEIEKIIWRTLLSLLILFLFSGIVYRNIKYISILFFSIFITLSISSIFYYFLQIELQLYSLAGITLSFGVIIDNTIIMMDHVRRKGDMKIFLALVAATLTTLGAVSVIFFFEEARQANLIDFAWVIVINLGVSLLVAKYLVPALMDRFGLQHKKSNVLSKRKKNAIYLLGIYERVSGWMTKPIFKLILIAIMIFGFGLPVQYLPNEVKSEGFFPGLYNSTLGGAWFSMKVRPFIQQKLGGAIGLFINKTFEESYNQEPERTYLRILGAMPEGGTIEQLNLAIKKLEVFLSNFEEIEQYQTTISNYNNSSLSVTFKEDYEFSSFPGVLKSMVESHVSNLGGADWQVFGVGRGFSNILHSGQMRENIVLRGYNYDRLHYFAELLKKMLVEEAKGRIKDIQISNGGWNQNKIDEYHLELNPEKVAWLGMSRYHIYSIINQTAHYGRLPPVIYENELQQVKVRSDKQKEFGVWDLNNTMLTHNDRSFKLGQMATIERIASGYDIKKVNQEFELVIEFNFIGVHNLASRIKKAQIERMSEILPIGYHIIENMNRNVWDKKDETQYYYLFVVVLIIFFICAILLESLRQPLAVISMVPISFIGLFLTFYCFNFNFDQGGYAAFILLCGLSVNAALYIVNEYNSLIVEFPRKNRLRLYIKAFGYKVVPIMLTIISTIVGLIPFVWNGKNDAFWFAFAVGTIGGLIFSLIGILVYLPIFVLKSAK